jgi:hypothetical protein
VSYEKVTIQNIASVADIDADVTLQVGGVSGTGGTSGSNQFVGDRLWNNVAYTLNNFGITGGTWTVTVNGQINGMSNSAPVARVTGLGGDSAPTVVLDNLCQAPCSPTPFSVTFDETAAGTTLTGVVSAIGKTNRGVIPSGPSNNFRVIEGEVFALNTITATTTFDISANPASGSTVSRFRGLDRLSLWDCAMFWVETQEIESGDAWDVAIVGDVNGSSTVLATTGAAGVIAAANTVYPLASNFYGSMPRPNQIIVTGTTATGITAQIYGIAKASRGARYKV